MPNWPHSSFLLSPYYHKAAAGFLFLSSLLFQGHYIVCTPLSAGGWVEPPNKFLKKGGLTGSQVLDVVAGKEGVTFFQWGLQFLHKKTKI